MPRRLAILLGLPLVLATACEAAEKDRRGGAEARTTPPSPTPARPASCTSVPAGANLQAWVDRVQEGAALCLGDGNHRGPVVITRRVTLWGSPRACIRSHGVGTTVRVEADGTALLGFTVDGSGTRHDQQDAAVAVKADDVRVEGLRVVHATFGILADRSFRVTLRSNHVEGDPRQPRGLRGDGIRLWETRDSVVTGNVMRDSRDLVVWYSYRNEFTRNVVERGRYGTHFMHSHENVVTHNEFVGNAVGVFVMYSHDVRVEDNLFLDSFGAGGMGVGLKDSGDVTLRRNTFVHDSSGVYVDNSPSTIGQRDIIEGNAFRLCDAAIVFHGNTTGNEVRGNSLCSNREQVVVEGGGDARRALWEGNHYDDYVGYDLDGDGTGDVPYELRRLSTHLSSGIPNLAFFRGTPAFGVVDVLGKVVPLFTPHTLLVDERPRMDDPVRVREVRRAN
jgi:nitrous oxidase accessory protein